MKAHMDAQALKGVARLLFDQVVLYQKASVIAVSLPVRKLLGSARLERATLLVEVNRRIQLLGARLSSHSTGIGLGQQAVLNFRSFLDNDDKAALGEIDRGENYLRGQIQKRIDRDGLSPSVDRFLEVILDRIMPGRDQIAAMRHQLH